MTPKHTLPFHVFQQDIDCSNRMSVMALVRAILNAACMAADDNGFGTIQLNEKGLTWVLSRISIEMERYPESEHDFVITTWIENCGNLVSTRNFRIEDPEGDFLGSACSLWSVIDMETRQPINLQTIPELFEVIVNESVPVSKPRHIALPIEADEVIAHRVVYSDLDFNRHVNSTRYIEWMMNVVPMPIIEEHEIKGCSINYSAEVHYGEEVDVLQKTEELCTKCGVKKGDKVLCSMKIDWK